MKKIAFVALLLVTSCGGYETLSTPFQLNGKGINQVGTQTAKSSEKTNTYEIVVNAPAGTPQAVADSMFDSEARRVCAGRDYDKVMTASGTVNIRTFGVKGVTTDTIQTEAPSLKGYATCK